MTMRRKFWGFIAALGIGATLAAPLPPVIDYLSPIIAAEAANVVKSIQIIPSPDNQLHSRFPAGDGPSGGDICDVPAGWACANVGDGAGKIEQVTATEWDFDVIGSNNREEHRFAYQDAGGADVQLIARIDASAYTGNTFGFAGLAIGLRDAITQSAWFHACRVPAEAATSVSGIYRLDATNFQSENGAPAQAQPRWVAMTYDFDNKVSKCHESSTGAPGSWTEVQSTIHDYSDVIAYVSGNSSSATEAMQGTADNIALTSTITVYTPPDPPDGSAPVVVTPIPNQVVQQGNTFNLNCSSNFTDPDTDPITYTSNVPTNYGVSMNTNCQWSGAFNATALAASPFNIVVTADDVVDGSVEDTFQVTVNSSGGGDTFGPYGALVTTIDCTQPVGTGATFVDAHAGDTILLAGGNRGALDIRDCVGTLETPLVITNDPSATSPTVIRATGTSSTSFLLDITNVSGVTIGPGGSGAKYSGGPAGWCGVSEDDNSESTLRWLEDGETTCGIVVTRTNTDNPTAYIKVGGLSTKWTIQGFEVDGVNLTDGGGSGLGVSVNDHNINEDEFPTFWREDMNLLHFYIHDVGSQAGGEGIYFGPNGYGRDGQGTVEINDLPLRRARIGYGIVDGSSKECINPKYWLQGPNFIDHNHVYRCGIGTNYTGTGRAGISMVDGGDVDIHSNWVEEPGQQGITHGIINAITGGGDSPVEVERDSGPYYSNIYNNYIIRTGNFSGETGECVKYNRNAGTGGSRPGTRAQFSETNVYNNTCISPDTDAYEIASSITGSKSIRDNIIGFTGCTSLNDQIVPIGAAENNRCDDIADHDFANAGNDNFHLTDSSPARNAATNKSPPVDYDGNVRPQQAIDDQGADEYVP